MDLSLESSLILIKELDERWLPLQTGTLRFHRLISELVVLWPNFRFPQVIGRRWPFFT